MSIATHNFDVNRAIGILNVAKKHGMYVHPLPEADGDKIMEAEKIVAQAQQAEKVAQEAGEANVSNIQALRELLFEAFSDVGTGPNGPDADPQSEVQESPLDIAKNRRLPFPRELTQEETELYGRMSANDRAAFRKKIEAEVQGSNASVTGDTEAVVSVEHESGGTLALSAGDKWIDEDGIIWVVDSIVNDKTIEAHEDGKTEKTLLPTEFLKARVWSAGSSSAQTSSQPSSPPSPPSSSELDSSNGDGPTSATTTQEPSSAPSSSEPPLSQPDPSSSSSSTDVISDDDEGDEQYRKVLDQAEAVFQAASLPLPQDIENPLQMPEDLTMVGDLEARRLHSQRNACAARAHYLLGIERQKRIGCDRIRKALMRPAMRQAREQLGKEATVTELTQVAEENEDVAKWKSRVEYHSDQEEAYKDLFQIYTEDVTVLSRDWTMRESNEQGSK